MKKLLLSSLFCLIGFLFTGCIATIVNDLKMVPATENIKNYKSDTISDRTKTDLFLYMSKVPSANHVLVYMDGNYTTEGEPLSSSYYLYYQVEPGIHWINIKSFYTTSTYYLCKDFPAGTKAIIDLAYPTRNVNSSDMDIKNSSSETLSRLQVKQKVNEISSDFAYDGSITSANIEVLPNDSKTLSLLKKTLKNNFKKLSIQKGDSLTIKISIPDNIKPFRSSQYLSMEFIKLEFFKQDEKISEYVIVDFFDERYSNESDYSMATRITSYIACKYFRKQYPIYKQ